MFQSIHLAIYISINHLCSCNLSLHLLPIYHLCIHVSTHTYLYSSAQGSKPLAESPPQQLCVAWHGSVALKGIYDHRKGQGYCSALR